MRDCYVCLLYALRSSALFGCPSKRYAEASIMTMKTALIASTRIEDGPSSRRASLYVPGETLDSDADMVGAVHAVRPSTERLRRHNNGTRHGMLASSETRIGESLSIIYS